MNKSLIPALVLATTLMLTLTVANIRNSQDIRSRAQQLDTASPTPTTVSKAQATCFTGCDICNDRGFRACQAPCDSDTDGCCSWTEDCGSGGGGGGGGNPALTAPTGLDFDCNNPGNSITMRWNPVNAATRYAVRVDNTTNPWSGDCSNMYPGDYCLDSTNIPATITIDPNGLYGWWVHARDNNNNWGPATNGPLMRCAPNCSNIRALSGVTYVQNEPIIYVGNTAQFAVDLSSLDGALAGAFVLDTIPNSFGYQAFTTTSATLTANWTPSISQVGTHTLKCRAWNDARAECRAAGLPLDAAAQYTCTGTQTAFQFRVVNAAATPTTAVPTPTSATPTPTTPVSTPTRPASTPTTVPSPTQIPAMCRQDASITIPAVTITPGLSITPTGTFSGPVINFQIKFQGIELNNISSETSKTQKVKVTLVKQISSSDGTGTSTVFSKTFTDVPVTATTSVDANNVVSWKGTLNAEGVAPGDGYSILIKGPKHLQRKICENNPSEQLEKNLPYRCLGQGKITLTNGQNNLNLNNILLQGGDLPGGGAQDGILNAFDVSLIINMIKDGQSKLASDLAIADIDLNGIVNAKDRSYLIETLEEKYGDEE